MIHDIACPLCREKYGDTDGKHQELESPPLVEAFFAELPVDRADVARISWLAAHHHTYTDIGGVDHQILLEADYLVNADEHGDSRPAVENFRRRIFRTAAQAAPECRYGYFGDIGAFFVSSSCMMTISIRIRSRYTGRSATLT